MILYYWIPILITNSINTTTREFLVAIMNGDYTIINKSYDDNSSSVSIEIIIGHVVHTSIITIIEEDRTYARASIDFINTHHIDYPEVSVPNNLPPGCLALICEALTGIIAHHQLSNLSPISITDAIIKNDMLPIINQHNIVK